MYTTTNIELAQAEVEKAERIIAKYADRDDLCEGERDAIAAARALVRVYEPMLSGARRKQLVSAAEAARCLNVQTSTITRRIKAGEIPAVRTPGGHWRIRATWVEAERQRRGIV